MEHTCRVEVYLNEFSEARRIVVLESLRVTKGFEQWVRVQYLLLNCRVGRLVLHCFRLGWLLIQEVLFWATEALASSGKVSKNDLCGFSFTGTTLTRDNDRLVSSVDHQVLIGVFGDHEQMGLGLLHGTPCSRFLSELPVLLRYRSVENGQPLERIHR